MHYFDKDKRKHRRGDKIRRPRKLPWIDESNVRYDNKRINVYHI